MATTASGIESLRTTAVTLEGQVDRFRLQSNNVKMGRSGSAPAVQHHHAAQAA
jgi:methyl-accepting chemotaxis protein